MTVPYGRVATGHPRTCDCQTCAESRAAHVEWLLQKAQLPTPPKSIDATVFVRAHFRRQAGHMRRYRRSLLAVTAVLKKAVNNG